jgi:zinc transport system ATP-binding protein
MGNKLHSKSKNSCSGLCCTKIQNFGVKRGNTDILTDVNVHVHCGELTALIGPNGAGKSTLLKAILGEIKHSGSLQFMSVSGGHGGKPVIGYVPQSLGIDRSAPANVLDLFVATGSKRPAWLPVAKNIRNRAEDCLDRVGVKYLLNRRLGALSGGEIQRVMLALALEPVPDLLLLDEPVSGVDQNGMKAFYERVSTLRSEYDLSIIIVSHDLELIPTYADRVILLDKTILASGSPDEVYSSDAFSEVFPAHALNNRNNHKNYHKDVLDSKSGFTVKTQDLPRVGKAFAHSMSGEWKTSRNCSYKRGGNAGD